MNNETHETIDDLGFANTNSQKIKRVFYPLKESDITKPHINYRDEFVKSKLMLLNLNGMLKFIYDEGLTDDYTHYVVVPLREFQVHTSMGRDEKYNGVYVHVPYDFPLKPQDIKQIPNEYKDITELDIRSDDENEEIKEEKGIDDPDDAGTVDDDKFPPFKDNEFTLAIESRSFNW